MYPINHRRFILNVVLPLGLSLYSGIGHVFPTVDINSIKKIIIYILCSIPAFYAAHLATCFSENKLKHTKLPRNLFVLSGAMLSIPFCFFYTWFFWFAAWTWVPWLRGGFSYDFSAVAGDFTLYLMSGSTLLFVPVWYCSNLLYEYATRDFWYFGSTRGRAPAGPAAPSTDSSPDGVSADGQAGGFIARIPARLGRNIIAVRAQQHYVRVYTTAGDDLILYRFGDVVSELETRGLAVQVHRSFCVAPWAISRMARGARSTHLVMTNGLKVPVSQSYRALLDKHYSGECAATDAKFSEPVAI